MANVHAEAAAGGNGCMLSWSLDFDDVADTVTINATHTRFDGSACADPLVAGITVVSDTGQAITLDLLTARLGTGQLFDGDPASMVNSGPRTRTSVKLRVSANRAALLEFSTQYQPPVSP